MILLVVVRGEGEGGRKGDKGKGDVLGSEGMYRCVYVLGSEGVRVGGWEGVRYLTGGSSPHRR